MTGFFSRTHGEPVVRGLWVWSSDPKDQERVLQKVVREKEFGGILAALASNQSGLSNAQIDKMLRNNSQWRTLWYLRELTALDVVEYKADLFGEPGRYILTERGKALLAKVAD